MTSKNQAMTGLISDISPRQFINICLMESKIELLKVMRSPGFSVPALLFPIVFYLFFGIIFSMNPATMPTYLLATYGTFGVIGPAFFSFGVGIAIERGQGWFSLKEASPMPAAAYVFSRIAVTLIFSITIILLLFVLGAAVGDVRLYSEQWLLMAIILLLGSLPFCAIGLFLGLLLKANSAAAIINLLYLPMAFLSGLWVPISYFPQLMQTLANVLPAYHLSQLALKVVDMDVATNLWLHILVLMSYFVIFMLLAIKTYYKKDKN